jgi:hypothetical protein
MEAVMRKLNNLPPTVMKAKKVMYSFTEGVIFPDTIPYGGEMIQIASNTHRTYRTIPVGERGKVVEIPQVFDVLAYTVNFDRDERLFQILPTNDPRVGRLVFLSQSSLVNNLRNSGRRFFYDDLDIRLS